MSDSSRHKKAYRKARKEMYEILGNACECCGTTWQIFFQIDHANGGGHQERRATNGSFWKLRKAVREAPTRYRLLCANCHSAKTAEVPCPCREETPCLA